MASYDAKIAGYTVTINYQQGGTNQIGVKKPAKVIGTNTISNMQSGLFYGYIGLVDGILERLSHLPAFGEAH